MADAIPRVIPQFTTKPRFDSSRKGKFGSLAILRDAIPTQVVISFSALFGFAISYIPYVGKPILGLGLLSYALYTPIRLLLIHSGLLANPHMSEVIPGVHTPRFPGTPKGEGAPEFAVIILTSRCNSPLGLFDPTFKQVGDSFMGMMKTLQTDPSYGCVNAETFLSTRRENNNSIMTFFYFKSVEGVHKFANEGLHKSAWMEFARNHTKYPHIELEHELFRVQESGFESLHLNSAPHGAAWLFDVEEDKEGGKVWESTLRKLGASGSGGNSKGRMAGGK